MTSGFRSSDTHVSGFEDRAIRFHRPLATAWFGHWLFSSELVVMRDERAGHGPFSFGSLAPQTIIVCPGLRGMPPGSVYVEFRQLRRKTDVLEDAPLEN